MHLPDTLDQLVGGLRIFAAQLARTRGSADRAAWRMPGAEATVFDLAFGKVPAPMAAIVHVTEVVVHGLDIAVATGQEHLADQAEAATLLATMRAMGTDAFRRPGIFGPERTADEDDPAHRQLLAYLGRDLALR